MVRGTRSRPTAGAVEEPEAGTDARRRPLLGRLRSRLFGMSVDDCRPERRGFAIEGDAKVSRLLRVGTTFLIGYHAALLDPRPELVASALSGIERGWRGFGFEGAGMGLAIVDALAGGRGRRLRAFAAGPAASQRYLVYVGAGWSLARLPRRVAALRTGLDDPFLQWLVLDGYGFYLGFFATRHAVAGQRVPRRLGGYARRAFDLGLGRSLWFVYGMEPDRVAEGVARFPEGRRGDLWSGVGLACTYGGGLEPAGVERLRLLAGRYEADAAQGSAFAARLRVEADDAPPELDAVCRALCGLDAAAAWALTEECAVGLTAERGGVVGGEPGFEVWRRRIRGRLGGGGG